MVKETYNTYREELADSPYIYVRTSSYLDVRVYYSGPYLSNYFWGYLGQEMEELGSADITITVQLPFITLGQISVSTSLVLFLAAVAGMLVLIGLVFVYDWRHERPTRLVVRAGPALLFVLSFLVPWASGHNMWVYGSTLHDVYWTFAPGVLTIAQSADIGHFVIMPMQPVGLFSGLWLCLGLFLYSHVRNTNLGWQVRLLILAIALPLAALQAVFLTLRYWDPINVYLAGPLLILTSIVWRLLLAPKRNTAANPAVTAK